MVCIMNTLVKAIDLVLKRRLSHLQIIATSILGANTTTARRRFDTVIDLHTFRSVFLFLYLQNNK
jgi:hypothetical protein